MVRRDFGFKTILSQSTHYWLAGMIMFMITITIEQMFSPTIIHTGVIAIIGGAVYIGILLGMRECKIVCVNRYCMNLLYAPYWGKQR